MTNAGRVTGKVAVVIGGASGIGAATVKALAEEDATVMVADLDLPAAVGLANSVAGDVSAHHVDVTSEPSVDALAAAIVDRYGRLDILVNSAAVTDPVHQALDGDVTGLSLDVWDRTLAVDLTGTMLACRALVPLMLGGGSVINITSNAGLAGDTSLTAYAAAKAGLHGLTRSIATAFGRRGVRCNAVSPAHIASPSFMANVPTEVAAMLEENCLVPRLGRVEDVAAAIVFLASDESRCITGEVLRVDGGALAHLPTYAQRIAPG